MRVLLGTNQLQKETGSELLLSQFAAHCRQAGAKVVVFTNWEGWPMARNLEKAGISIVTDPSDLRPLDFDLVYFQHQIAGLFDYSPHPANAERTLFVFAKLTPEGFFESAGWELEGALGDLIFANSLETAAVIEAQGNALPVHVFHNAVPGDFSKPRQRSLPDRPRRVLVVSSRAESSLSEALHLLGDAVQVEHVKRSGDLADPGSAAKIREADLVIALGRAVPHALAARTPVYVYDQYGGPGYLDDQNFDAAARANFSGRCTPQARTPSAVAEDIMAGYGKGRRFATTSKDDIVHRYILSRHFDLLLNAAGTSNAERHQRLVTAAGALLRERRLAEFVRSSYRKAQALTRSAKP